MNPREPLAGQLWLRPGQARPRNLRSTRPDWVPQLTQGLPAQRLATTLASLFSLCGHAHRLCASLAVQAAQGHEEPPSPAQRQQLAEGTLREHLRRIGLDWPRQLHTEEQGATEVQAMARALATCPALGASPSGATDVMRDWIRAHLTGLPPAQWLKAWQQDPAAWLADWCAQPVGPACWLRGLPAQRWEVRPLQVHARAASLTAWAGELREGGAAFGRQPLWQDRCAETGVWTRLADPHAPRLDTPALRLGARLAEVVRLAQHDTAWLALGALPLARGEALAWVEMARGLLVHHVVLDGPGAEARVAQCQVVAPTDWNFHPQGAVAALLETLPVHVPAPVLGAWMAAYDPCVSYQQESPWPEELAHA